MTRRRREPEKPSPVPRQTPWGAWADEQPPHRIRGLTSKPPPGTIKKHRTSSAVSRTEIEWVKAKQRTGQEGRGETVKGRPGLRPIPPAPMAERVAASTLGQRYAANDIPCRWWQHPPPMAGPLRKVPNHPPPHEPRIPNGHKDRGNHQGGPE